MKESGTETKCMATVFSGGTMDAHMKVNSEMIGKKDMVSSYGKTGESMMDSGVTASKTGSVISLTRWA